jgi:hypothetical protein
MDQGLASGGILKRVLPLGCDMLKFTGFLRISLFDADNHPKRILPAADTGGCGVNGEQGVPG